MCRLPGPKGLMMASLVVLLLPIGLGCRSAQTAARTAGEEVRPAVAEEATEVGSPADESARFSRWPKWLHFPKPPRIPLPRTDVIPDVLQTSDTQSEYSPPGTL